MKISPRLPLFSIITSLGIAGSASAATVVWQGGTGSFTDANWIVGGVSDQNAPDFGSVLPATNQYSISTGVVNGFTSTTARSGDTVTITGGASIFGDFISVNAAETEDFLTLESGSITMSSFNPFRTNPGGFVGHINFTGAAGSGTVTHTDLGGTVAQNLAGKISATGGTASYFAIDGVNVVSSTAFNGSNLVAVNSDLAGTVVNGRYFQISESGGEQTLFLVAVPEPSSSALLGLAGLLLTFRRRR